MHPLPGADEEDVALSALKNLWLLIMQGELEAAKPPQELWSLLKTMVRFKLIDYRRYHGARRRSPAPMHEGEMLDEDVHMALDPSPTVVELAMIEEQKESLLNELGDATLRQIAIWKMDGHSNTEIAQMLGVCARTVERKLERIRKQWAWERLS